MSPEDIKGLCQGMALVALFTGKLPLCEKCLKGATCEQYCQYRCDECAGPAQPPEHREFAWAATMRTLNRLAGL